MLTLFLTSCCFECCETIEQSTLMHSGFSNGRKSSLQAVVEQCNLRCRWGEWLRMEIVYFRMLQIKSSGILRCIVSYIKQLMSIFHLSDFVHRLSNICKIKLIILYPKALCPIPLTREYDVVCMQIYIMALTMFG